MSALPQHDGGSQKKVENLAPLFWLVYKRYSQLQLTQINRGIVWHRNITRRLSGTAENRRSPLAQSLGS